MARLPVPGSDQGTWGDILNEFLLVSLNPDGTSKLADTVAAKYTKPASGIPEADLSGAVQAKLNTPVPDASAGTKGIIQLTGDLGGSATSPTVPGLANKADDNTVVKLTGNQSVAGIKTFSSSPVVPTPTADMQAATKKYVDDAIVGGGGYTDEQAQDAIGSILTDSSEIDFTYDDDTPSISASIATGSIDETKLDASVNASLALADSATQPGDLASVATSGDYDDLSNKPTIPADLGDLSDVTITSPENDQILAYDSGQWINKAAPAGGAVDSVNGQSGAVVLDADDIDDAATSHKFASEAELTKLSGIEEGADVTDATNVDAAGAVMNSDESTTEMLFVIDEDDMSSDTDTKVPTQQSVKAYVDTSAAAAANAMGVVAHGATAATARPSGYAHITWIGSVEPDNALDNDIWFDTSA